MTNLSNQDRGRLAVERLIEEIEAREAVAEMLPLNDGALHIGMICQILGVGRSTPNQNSAFKQVLIEYAERKGLSYSRGGGRSAKSNSLYLQAAEVSQDVVPASRLREEERRSQAAEKRVAELLARNAELMAQVRRLSATDELLIASGRRYKPTAEPCGLPLLTSEQYDR